MNIILQALEIIRYQEAKRTFEDLDCIGKMDLAEKLRELADMLEMLAREEVSYER